MSRRSWQREKKVTASAFGSAVCALLIASVPLRAASPPRGEMETHLENRAGVRMLKVVPKRIKRAWVLATLKPTKEYRKLVDEILKACKVPEKQSIRFKTLHAVAVEGTLSSDRATCLREHARVAQVEKAIVPPRQAASADGEPR